MNKKSVRTVFTKALHMVDCLRYYCCRKARNVFEQVYKIRDLNNSSDGKKYYNQLSQTSYLKFFGFSTPHFCGNVKAQTDHSLFPVEFMDVSNCFGENRHPNTKKSFIELGLASAFN